MYGPSDATNGIPTRVLRNDLTSLSSFMKSNFQYETGAFENFDYLTNSDKFLIRLDYNINDYNKFNIRYSHHNSISDAPISNSAQLGNGNRANQGAGVSVAYENAGYQLQDNTRSIVAELNSTFGSSSLIRSSQVTIIRMKTVFIKIEQLYFLLLTSEVVSITQTISV
ncbi:MAG: hypothetical protein HC817_09960 [Saprospiraceae bacterium]|nr:hypothetical protein [Saprospiraceae bacterium]